MTEKGRAIWVLAILSPVIAELCSGSSPPFEFFIPTSFALLLGLYGAGVLVARELAVRWNLGWLGIVVLGAAYGILEEGVAIKSFFDPEWMDLGGLGVYGRFLGTNWVWAVWLTIFHATVSITTPIALTWLVYPSLRRERLLTKKRFIVVLGILLVDVFVCLALLNPYPAYLPMYILSIAAVLFLVWYAKQIPRGFMAPRGQLPTWSPMRFAFLGFMLLFVNFLLSAVFVDTGVHPIVPIVLMIAFCGFVAFMIRDHLGLTNNLPQTAHFVCGVLSFLVLFGFLTELGGMLGMSVVAFLLALFTIDLARWSKGKKVFLFRVYKLLHGPAAPQAV